MRKACINGFGALTTLIVLCFIVYEKFKEGAWIVIAADRAYSCCCSASA